MIAEVHPGVYFIEGEDKGRFPYSNSLLIKGKAIVDLGCGLKHLRKLASDVSVAVLSHTHPDHCSGAWLFNKLSIRVLSPAGHPTTLEALAKRFAGEELASTWVKYVKQLIGLRSFSSEPYWSEEPILESPEVTPIHAPGHTADMHVILIEGKVLHSSDIDLTPFGPWYGHEESCIKQFTKSIEKVMSLGVEVLVPGHSKPVYGREQIERKLQKYMEVLEERSSMILSLLSKPRTLRELVDMSPIYRVKPYAKPLLDYWEAQMIKKHLALLEEKGLVKLVGGAYCRVDTQL